MKFEAATLGTFLGMVAPLLDLLGVDTRGITMETAEDFEALEELGRQIMELGLAGKEGLADGSLSGADVARIFAEAKDLPGAAKALAAEVGNRELRGTEGDTDGTA